MTELHLKTVLEGRGPAAAIVLSDEQVESLGAGKAFPVVVDFGDRSIRLRLSRMGGQNMIPPSARPSRTCHRPSARRWRVRSPTRRLTRPARAGSRRSSTRSASSRDDSTRSARSTRFVSVAPLPRSTTRRSTIRVVNDPTRRSSAARRQQDPRGQRLVKFGLRFSRKADMPSFWSAVSKSAANACFSCASPSASGVSIAASSAAFAA